MLKRKIPLARPSITKDMEEAAIQALRNEHFVMGESVFKFEEEFATYVGVDHAVAVGSGTMALQLSLETLGIGEKRARVLTSPMSFVGTANAVIHAGGTPTFADVLPHSGLLDPQAVARGIQGVGALVPVHLYGTPAPMSELRETADEHGVPIVEDACQAHGADFQGKRAGALGHVGCFSFYSTKNLTVAGDGGMVTTDDDRLATRIRCLRDCGRVSQYEHSEIGYTSRLNSMNAAIGRAQLTHLELWNERRRRIASRYARGCGAVGDLTIPLPAPGCRPSYHLFALTTAHRNSLRQRLAERGVATGTHYPIPIHLQPAYRKRFGYAEGAFPRAEAHAQRVLTLPIYPDLSDAEVDYVVECLVDYFRGGG